MDSATPSGRALAYAAIAAFGTAAAWAVLAAALDFHLGLLAVAAFGGWLIGTSLRPLRARRGGVAIAFAAAAWLVGSILEFIVSQALLPAATTPLAERLAPLRYLDYLAATFDVVQGLAIAILVVVAWRSAR